jgi:hypothetical protein
MSMSDRTCITSSIIRYQLYLHTLQSLTDDAMLSAPLWRDLFFFHQFQIAIHLQPNRPHNRSWRMAFLIWFCIKTQTSCKTLIIVSCVCVCVCVCVVTYQKQTSCWCCTFSMNINNICILFICWFYSPCDSLWTIEYTCSLLLHFRISSMVHQSEQENQRLWHTLNLPSTLRPATIKSQPCWWIPSKTSSIRVLLSP